MVFKKWYKEQQAKKGEELSNNDKTLIRKYFKCLLNLYKGPKQEELESRTRIQLENLEQIDNDHDFFEKIKKMKILISFNEVKAIYSEKVIKTIRELYDKAFPHSDSFYNTQNSIIEPVYNKSSKKLKKWIIEIIPILFKNGFFLFDKNWVHYIKENYCNESKIDTLTHRMEAYPRRGKRLGKATKSILYKEFLLSLGFPYRERMNFSNYHNYFASTMRQINDELFKYISKKINEDEQSRRV